MKTARLTAILLAAAIILLLAVPQLRGTLDLLRFRPIATQGTWLRKAEVGRAVKQHTQDAQMWLAFAECGTSSQRGTLWDATGPWDQSWSPQPAYERAISLAPDSAVPQLRYALYLLSQSEHLPWKELRLGDKDLSPEREEVAISPAETTKLRRTEKHLRQARARDPHNAACDYLLASIYLTLHENDQALIALREAITKPHWDLANQAAAIAVLRLLDATGSASPLVEAHVFSIAIGNGTHATAQFRSLSRNIDDIGEQFRKSDEPKKAILCYEAAVHLGYVMRKDAYWAIDGLASIAITKMAAASFLSEEERERIIQEVPVTADEGRYTEEILTSLRAMRTYGKDPRGREMQRYFRERGKREAVKSAQQRKEEEGVWHQQDERMRRTEDARVANFAAYMRKQGRADLAKLYPQEVQAANQWKNQARAAADGEVPSAIFLYGWPRCSRLLWLQAGLLLALWLLVGLISLVVQYWREPRADLAWPWWQGLLLMAILVGGVPVVVITFWYQLFVYSWFYPYPIYMRAAILGLSLVIGGWLVVVLVVTLLKRTRQAPTQRFGKARTYLATLRVLVPVTFAALFLLSVISLWPARQSIKPWREQTRAQIQQGEVRYLGIGATDLTNHEPPGPRY